MEVLPTSHDINHVIKLGKVPPTVEIAKELDKLKSERAEVNITKKFYIVNKNVFNFYFKTNF